MPILSSHAANFLKNFLLYALIFLGSSGSSQAENTLDVATLAGRWVGEGQLISKTDEVEKLRCRVTFLVRGKGKIEQNIRCKSSSYQIEVRNNLLQSGSKVSGTWVDRLNEMSGTISGKINGQSIEALVKSEVFDSKLAVDVDKDKQKIELKPINGPVKRVAFQLSRG